MLVRSFEDITVWLTCFFLLLLVQSVVFTAVPFFVVAAVWFVIFGLCLSFICLCYCCCSREPYGYSRLAYALSLILLILFTLAAMYSISLTLLFKFNRVHPQFSHKITPYLILCPKIYENIVKSFSLVWELTNYKTF